MDQEEEEAMDEEVEKEEEEREGGETMDDVIRTAKEVSSLLKAPCFKFSTLHLLQIHVHADS